MESKADELKKPVVYLSGINSFVVHLLYVIFVPLRLYDIYMTYGLSLQFAHFALAAFMLALCLARLCERIGFDAYMILSIPASIGFLATYEWDVVFCMAVVGASVFFIVVLVVLVSCDKNGEVKDIPLPVGAKEDSV